MKKRKSRPTIGMLICTLDYEYQANVWNHMADAAIEYNVNLLFFVGKPLASPTRDHFQQHIIYNLARTQSLDGLIILSSTIGNFITRSQLENFCK